MKRIGTWILAVLPLLALDAGCILDGGPSIRSGDDAGAVATDAAGRTDGAPMASDAPPPPGAAEVPTDSLGNDADYAAACLDGVDADRTGGLDCADDECAAAPSCCVGSTSEACCTGGGSLFTLSFVGCADAASCGATAQVVGAPTLASGLVARVADGAMADSGILVSAPLDLRGGHVSLTASVVATESTAGTVDAVAVGLYPSNAGGARSLPIAAMQISASRGEVAIVAGDVAVAAAPLAASTGPASFTLTLTPTGEVHLVGPSVDLTATIAVPPALLRVGAIGRSEASTTSPIRVESIVVTRAACDVPAALLGAAVVLEDRTGLYDESTVSSPSAVLDVTPRLLAFDAILLEDGRRAIFLGVEDAARPGTFVVEATAARPQPILRSDLSIDEVSQPALGWTGTHWTLYATGLTNGRRTIVHATTTDDGFDFAIPALVEAPEDDWIDGSSPERDHPALVPGRPTILVAREHTIAGTALVVLDVSDTVAGYLGGVCDADSEFCAEDPTARAADRILSPRLGTLEADADEVAAPTVARFRGVYRLYYAGRRGNRWSIGVAVSADARYWRRPLTGDVVLGPTGSGAGALGARDPDVHVAIDGRVDLFYAAWNGFDTAIARATQVIRQ